MHPTHVSVERAGADGVTMQVKNRWYHSFSNQVTYRFARTIAEPGYQQLYYEQMHVLA